MGSADLLTRDGLGLSKIPDLQGVPLGEPDGSAVDADDGFLDQLGSIGISATPVTSFNSSI
jgi:hypothetical protein